MVITLSVCDISAIESYPCIWPVNCPFVAYCDKAWEEACKQGYHNYANETQNPIYCKKFNSENLWTDLT